MTDRLAYTIRETAELLGVSTDLVYKLCERGELSYVLAGRRKLIRAESLELWMERSTVRQPTRA